MTQWARVFAVKPNNLGLIQETQKRWKESPKFQELSPHELHVHTHAKQ